MKGLKVLVGAAVVLTIVLSKETSAQVSFGIGFNIGGGCRPVCAAPVYGGRYGYPSRSYAQPYPYYGGSSISFGYQYQPQMGYGYHQRPSYRYGGYPRGYYPRGSNYGRGGGYSPYGHAPVTMSVFSYAARGGSYSRGYY